MVPSSYELMLGAKGIPQSKAEIRRQLATQGGSPSQNCEEDDAGKARSLIIE